MTTNDEPCCRICYEGPESDASDSDNIRVMVSPCGCSGSSAHIHVDCLKKLYLSRRGMCDQLHCPTCKQKYDAVNSLMLATFNLIRLRSVERAIGITRNHLQVLESILLEKADAYSTMGTVLCGMGSYQTASTFYDMDLTLKLTTYGADHPAVALSLNNKGSLLCRQQKNDESEQCLNRAMEILERAYDGADSPQVANVLCNLSLVYRNKNDCRTALQLIDRCVCILNNQKGNTHEMSLNTARMERSMLLLQLSRFDEAEQQARQCLDYGRRAFSKSNSDLLKWEGIMALILKKGEVGTVESSVETSLLSSKKRGRDQASRTFSVVTTPYGSSTIEGLVKRLKSRRAAG